MIIKDQLNRAYSPDMESAEKDNSKQSQTVSSIPAGGYTGQVLAKASSADGDVLWKTSSGGAGGAVNTVNTLAPDGTGNVTLTQDNIADGTTNKAYTATEKTKLAGIATGAQVNTSKVKASATDTTEGYLGSKLVAGTNVTITKNNSGANETYTIASTGGGGSATWGGITGTLSAQTDLSSALNGKQGTLVSGTNIKTINGTSILGSGNMVIGGGAGAVDSVNSITPVSGNVTLTQDNIGDGTTYKQYSTTEKAKVGVITTTGDGSKYLADDGQYKTVSGGSSSLLDPVADLAALKAINTTTFTTIKEIQVQTLGKYKFQSASTLTGDDNLVITPTTGSSAGRWVKQSMVIKPVYTFEEIDYGVSASLRFKNKNGGLTIRGNGTYGGSIVTGKQIGRAHV